MPAWITNISLQIKNLCFYILPVYKETYNATCHILRHSAYCKNHCNVYACHPLIFIAMFLVLTLKAITKFSFSVAHRSFITITWSETEKSKCKLQSKLHLAGQNLHTFQLQNIIKLTNYWKITVVWTNDTFGRGTGMFPDMVWNGKKHPKGQGNVVRSVDSLSYYYFLRWTFKH